jgi:energy-converting hydrogenase B subunit Q
MSNESVPVMPEMLRDRYAWMKSHSALEETSGFLLEIKSRDRIGLIADITRELSGIGGNISYLQSWNEHDGSIHTLVQIDDNSLYDAAIETMHGIPSVEQVESRPSHRRTYGKRIIVIGGGAQVAQVASGAIAEADRHNIRGETISVDTLPVVGEHELAEAVRGTGRLHRVGIVVLAGALMGGEITRAVTELRNRYGIPVISLRMAGSVCDAADLVVTDPIEAGVMAVMLISHVGQFDLTRVYRDRY